MPKPRFSRLAPALAACCVLASPITASASDCNDDTHLGTCIEPDTLWPHAGAGHFQSIGATETTAPMQFSFGLVTTYLRKPIVLRAASSNPSGTDIPAVDHLVDSSFLWAFGITDRLEASAVMPLTLYRTGSGISAFASSQARELPKTSLHDLRLGLAYALLPRPRAFPGSHYALTARFEAAMPTGEEQWFAGDRAPVWMPSIAADYRRGPWFAGLELGARLRQTTDLAGARIGSQGFASLGIGMDILPHELLSATVEAFALPSLVKQTSLHRDPGTQEIVTESSSRKLIPAEWMAGVRTAPTADGDVSFSLSGGTAIPLTSDSAMTTPVYRFVLGARYTPLERDSDGDGVLDRDDQCPQEKEDIDGFEDQDGCDDRDNDRDGVPDVVDRCRDKAEDKDGYQDEDGCPDPDNDGDGIPDDKDKCPNEAETIDGKDDADGCPEPGAKDMTVVSGANVSVTGASRFTPGQARVTPQMQTQLRMLAQRVMGIQPLQSVIVETFADSAGSNDRNDKLAADRADAIRQVLLAAGIPSNVLTVAVGDLAQKRPPNAPQYQVTVQRGSWK